MQNESETEFHRVYKVSPTQQLTKLTHLLRESGDVLSDRLAASWGRSHLRSDPSGQMLVPGLIRNNLFYNE